MEPKEHDLFTQAVAAARAGDRGRARDLLTRLLRLNSDDPQVWLWMSAVVDGKREQEYCLRSVLRLDPTNRAALHGMRILGLGSAEPKAPVRIAPRSVPPPPWRSRTARRLFSPLNLAVAGGVFLIGTLALAFIFLRPRPHGTAPELRPPTATPTIPPPPTTTPTPPPPDTVLLWTPVPPQAYSTPLGALLAFTPTPTPWVGVTPHPIYEAYESALRHFRQGEYEASIQFFDQLLAIEPRLADLHYLRAEALRFMGKLDEARQGYAEAVEQNPTFAPAYLGSAKIQLATDPNTYPANLDKAIQAEPTLVEAQLLKAHFLQRVEDWQALENAASQAIQAGLEEPQLQLYLARARFALGRPEAALQPLLNAMTKNPTLLPAYRLLGQILLDLDRAQEAVNPLMTYLVYRPDDPLAWLDLAMARIATGDHAQALEDLDRALQSNGDPALIYYWRGRTLILAGNPSAALEAFDIARGEPGTPEDLELFAAEAYLLDNQPEQAIEALSRLIGSTLNSLLRAQAMLRRAQIYESLDPPDLESALVDYQAVLGQPELPDEMRLKAQEGASRLEATPTPTAIPPGS